jgi:uncharacterized membrane protein YjjP (DUF1212 family)
MLVAGMILGPYALLYLRDQVLLDWWNVIYTFFSCLIGSLALIGINIAWDKPDFGNFFYNSISLLTYSMLGAGLTALLAGLFIGEFNPVSLLLLACGVGLLIGQLLSGAFLRVRFRQPL